jgi:hypothetical protein
MCISYTPASQETRIGRRGCLVEINQSINKFIVNFIIYRQRRGRPPSHHKSYKQLRSATKRAAKRELKVNERELNS